MPVTAWFSNDDAPVAPGGQVTLTLTVQNLGEQTESYTIVAAGLTAGWTRIERASLTLFGGSVEVVPVTFSPPAMASTTAGPTTVAVRAVPLGDAADQVVAETTIVVEAFDDVRIVALQPIQRARHRATFEFMVENHGNTLASCRLYLIDPTARVDGDFNPPAVGVAPGAASLARLRAKARRGVFRRSTRTLDFEVEATVQDGPPTSTPMSLVQSPSIPARTIGRLAGALALGGAVVAAWLLVVQPTIEDAAADQVDDRVNELLAASPPDATAVPSPDSSVPGTTPGDSTSPSPGEPTFFRLSVNTPLTQTIDEATTVPDGAVFDMTDVRIENPFNDRGVATLLVNGEPVFIWSLESIRGTYFEPRITPIRLQPGDNVAFSVRCDEIGDAARSTCFNAINVGGESRPIDD